MKTMTLTLAMLIVALAAPAAAQTVFPEKTGSLVSFRAQAFAATLDANGDPLTPAGASISLHFETDPETQIPGSCVVPDASLIGHFVDLSIQDDGTRRVMRGRTHEFADCTGARSDPSPNIAIVFFNGPGEPTLLPAQ